MVQINWTSQAKEDLKAVADYISLDSVRVCKTSSIKIKAKRYNIKDTN